VKARSIEQRVQQGMERLEDLQKELLVPQDVQKYIQEYIII